MLHPPPSTYSFPPTSWAWSHSSSVVFTSQLLGVGVGARDRREERARELHVIGERERGERRERVVPTEAERELVRGRVGRRDERPLEREADRRLGEVAVGADERDRARESAGEDVAPRPHLAVHGGV